jgi:predicted dehydrogenase
MPQYTAPLRVIQIGAGGMGRAWLRTLTGSADVELVGLVDLNLDVARAAAAEAGLDGIPMARSLTELVDSTQPEAVVNVTVPQAHHPVNSSAMRLGLPVLCEKPLSESLAECLSMVAASELTGSLLMVSQSRRYWQNLAAYRRQLAQLGPVGILSCEFAKAPHFGGFREVMREPLLVDMAIHQFDLARYLIGGDPISVYCESYNPAWSWFQGNAAAEAIFQFAGGVRFRFSGSWCSPGLETSWNGTWRASTAAGTAVWDGDNPPIAASEDQQLAAEIGDEPEQIAGSLAEFVHAVRTGQTPSGEVHGNVQSVAMVAAAVRSADSGLPVMINSVLEDAYAAAVRDETDGDVRQVLQSWPSVHAALAGEGTRPGSPHVG